MIYQKVDDEPATLSDYGDSIPLDSLTDKLMQQGRRSEYGDSIPLDLATDNIIRHGITDIEDTPFTKFRQGTLNVSDFIEPRYCEHKFYFEQKISKDVDLFDDCDVAYQNEVIPVEMSKYKRSKENMERGKSIRKELELEVCAPLKMPSEREEEVFANTLVETCRRLNVLIHNGMVREVPVMGCIGNEIVYGSINELRRSSVSKEAARLPAKYKKTTLLKSHNIHLVANHSKMSSKPLPEDHDHSSNIHQVSLNKDLLDGMLLSFAGGARFPTLFAWICERLSLDPNETFSNKYLAHLRVLEETESLQVSLPKGLTAAKSIRDLVKVLGQTISLLGLGDAAQAPTEGQTSDVLKIVYVSRRGGTAPIDPAHAPVVVHSGLRRGYIAHSPTTDEDPAPRKKQRLSRTREPKPISRLQVFHHHDELYDRQRVQHEITSILDFWHGQRKMSGPTGREMDSKCGYCPFQQRCPRYRDQYPAYKASGGFRLHSPDMP